VLAISKIQFVGNMLVATLLSAGLQAPMLRTGTAMAPTTGLRSPAVVMKDAPWKVATHRVCQTQQQLMWAINGSPVRNGAPGSHLLHCPCCATGAQRREQAARHEN